MKANPLRVNAVITFRQHKLLKKLSEQTGVKLSWLVQSAIAEYLERREPGHEGGNPVTSIPPDEMTEMDKAQEGSGEPR